MPHKELAQCAARPARPVKFLRGQPKESAQKPWNARAAHSSQHPGRFPKESMKRSQVETLAQCLSCEGPLRIGRVGIAISRRESAANLSARPHIPIGRCIDCAKRVQGRHGRQTSGALGAAAVQGGSEAFTLGVLMNKFVGCEAEYLIRRCRDLGAVATPTAKASAGRR